MNDYNNYNNSIRCEISWNVIRKVIIKLCLGVEYSALLKIEVLINTFKESYLSHIWHGMVFHFTQKLLAHSLCCAMFCLIFLYICLVVSAREGCATFLMRCMMFAVVIITNYFSNTQTKPYNLIMFLYRCFLPLRLHYVHPVVIKKAHTLHTSSYHLQNMNRHRKLIYK